LNPNVIENTKLRKLKGEGNLDLYELAGIGLCSTGHFTEILPPKFSSTFHPHHGSKSALYAST
jgi:hypothetical protein